MTCNGKATDHVAKLKYQQTIVNLLRPRNDLPIMNLILLSSEKMKIKLKSQVDKIRTRLKKKRIKSIISCQIKNAGPKSENLSLLKKVTFINDVTRQTFPENYQKF